MTQRPTAASLNSDEEAIKLQLIRMIQDCEVNGMDLDRLYKEAGLNIAAKSASRRNAR